MLTTTYTPSERANVQAVNNFGVSIMVAIASASSGQMLSHFGWASVALTVMPIAAIMFAVILLRAKSPTQHRNLLFPSPHWGEGWGLSGVAQRRRMGG